MRTFIKGEIKDLVPFFRGFVEFLSLAGSRLSFDFEKEEVRLLE